MARRLIAGVAILTVLIVIALLAAPRFIDVNHYRPLIESKLRDRLGRDVSLGPMTVSLVPLAFRVDNAVIADDAGFNGGRAFISMPTLYVRPKLLPLLHKEVEIKSVQLDRPTVELIRNEQGTWNFSTLAAGSSDKSSSQFSLDNLKIIDGQVAVTDRQSQQPRAVYDHIDLLLSDFEPKRPFSVDLRAHMPGAGQQVVAFQGKVGPLQRDSTVNTPVDARLSLKAVSLSGLQRFMHLPSLENSDATMTGQADIKNRSGNLISDGKFDIQNPRVHGVDIGYPIAIDYQVHTNLNTSTADIAKANVKLGSTPISLHGTINAQAHPAQIDATVQTSNESIAEVARLAAAFGAAFNAKSDINGTLSLDVHAQGPVTKPAMSGKVEVKNVRISGGEFREPVQVDDLALALSPDTVSSNEFTAKTGHTSATAQFAVSGYASDSPKVQAKLSTENADVGELLRMAHAYGISAVNGVNGSGVVSLNVSANGPIKQTDQLAFDGSGEIHNASLNLQSMTKPLAVRKADLRFSGNGANLSNLDASMGQTTIHGDMVVKNFAAPELQFSVAANRINVSEWEQAVGAVHDQASSPAPQNARGQKPPAQQEDGLISRTTGSGSLTADQIVYDELTVNNVHATVTLDHGTITAKPLTANLYNGQQTGTVVINTRSTPATYTVDSKLQGVDANQLLSAVSPVKQTIYGLLSANADTHFTTAAGARSILPTLNGKVSLNLKDGKIANVDLLHQLAAIGKFTGTARAVEPFTQLVQLTGDFDIKNGVAQTNDLKAALDAGSLSADGTMDFAQQRLNLHLTAVLSQQYSRSVGGAGIGGFLNTALANNRNELVLPVLVTGTFQAPQFAPDLQKVAEMKLQNLVPGIEDPSKLTNGVLGNILRAKPGPQPNGQQNPQNPVDNILDLFKNKK